MNKNMLYRSIPKVDVLLEDEAIQAMIEHYSRCLLYTSYRTAWWIRKWRYKYVP